MTKAVETSFTFSGKPWTATATLIYDAESESAKITETKINGVPVHENSHSADLRGAAEDAIGAEIEKMAAEAVAPPPATGGSAEPSSGVPVESDPVAANAKMSANR